MTKIYMTEPENPQAKKVGFAKKSPAMKLGLEHRRAGRSASVSEIVFPKMPKSELIEALINHDFEKATITKLRDFPAVKKVVKAA